ncbi:MAG TPA: sodium-dependent transporter, partial [Phycisphaerae bacterium]|nr:sodium-dependent transporter [Phycisphaerae bacterium]
MADTRENWGSRAGFVLAAIGSAVGLGNLWGFPYKLYKTGGGAFLIPYVIAMLFVGIPLLIAEFSLGHITQRSTPSAFARVKRPYAVVGWWQIILSFIIITYYAVILAWCGSFLVYSIEGIFQGTLPWAGVGVEGVKNASEFFYGKYLGHTSGFALGKMQLHVVVALFITWLAMYLCIFRGVKLVSKIVLWTVPLPWLMLLILTIRGLTLPGATQGMEYYLEPNFSQLADPQTWRLAFGQMFFSMSLAFGVMITYSSFLHRKSDLNNNAAIIGLADMGTSFVAGIAVFATLGGMAFATQQAGNPIPVDRIADGGPGLAFVAFPYALAQLPYAP